jgi:GNAT superfamily N-acetyltransferase
VFSHGEAALMVYSVSLPNGYVISDDRGRLNMGFVHDSLAGAYWAAGRPRALTERSWANCLCLGIYAPDGAQVGFGRLLTDYAFRAHLGDVFIQPDSRGLGLGRALIAAILAHPELATVCNWTLKTADAHGLYAQFGFRPSVADRKWMTLDRTPHDESQV